MPNDKFMGGGDYYQGQFTGGGAAPSTKPMTLGDYLNMDVAGFGGVQPANVSFPGGNASATAKVTPDFFSGFDASGNPVSINPAMQGAYDQGWKPAGQQTAKAAAGGGGGGSMLGAGSAVLGGIQTIGGLIGLLSTKEPEGYSLTADNRTAIAEGKREAQFGLSDTQRSAFNTGVREQTATDLFNARNLAGNSLSRAVFGLRRGATLSELNRLAVSDFNAMQQKRRYRDQLFGLEQGVQDRNTGLDWNVYNQKMQAYGGALQSGLTNMASFFNLGQAMNYLPGLAG